MTNQDLALKGLDWFADLGAPKDLIDTARNVLLNSTGVSQEANTAKSADDSGEDPARETATIASGPDLADVPTPALISIAIDPETAAIEPDGTQQFEAAGKYSDESERNLTKAVDWWSSDPSISIDANGLARARSVSVTVEIIATDRASGFTGRAHATVKAPGVAIPVIGITVDPVDPAIFSLAFPGQSKPPLRFTAKGELANFTTEDISDQVAWTSSNSNLLQIDNKGVATVGLGGGTVTVKATEFASSRMQGKTTVTISAPDPKSIGLAPRVTAMDWKEKRQFTATRLYSDGSKKEKLDGNEVTWTASDGLTVNNDGFATATGIGPGTITVTDTLNGATDSIDLTITGIRSFPTPYGAFKYFVPFEAQVKARYKEAQGKFVEAEQLHDELHRKDRAVSAAEQSIGTLQQILKEIALYTTGQGKRDALNARTAKLVDDGTQAFLRLFEVTLKSAKERVQAAQVALANAKDESQAAELRVRAAELEHELDALAAVYKGTIDFANPAAVLSALIDLDVAWEKNDNPFAKRAVAIDKQRFDREIQQAYKEIEDATNAVAVLEPDLKSAKERVKAAQDNSADHWRLTEADYDNNPKNKGLFRFSKMPKAIAAAEIEAAAAIGAKSAADVARKAIHDWGNLSKDPHEWMADPAENHRIINNMATEADQWWQDAITKQKFGKAKSEQFADIQVRARLATGQAPGRD